MRKTTLALSALALPLAACAQEEAAPPEPDPVVEEVEEPRSSSGRRSDRR